MTTCLQKSCSFSLLRVAFVNVYECVRASFPFGFHGGIRDLIVLIPDHCLSIYFLINKCLLKLRLRYSFQKMHRDQGHDFVF